MGSGKPALMVEMNVPTLRRISVTRLRKRVRKAIALIKIALWMEAIALRVIPVAILDMWQI
jgi:hypothetical protein